MNKATKTLVSAFLLLLIFSLAIFLRFYGLDWSLKDGAYSYHPDERHCVDCVTSLNPEFLTDEEKQLPWREQWSLFQEKNLHVEYLNPQDPSKVKGDPGLRPTNYNYGTLSFYIYWLYQQYLINHTAPGESWNFLAWFDWSGILALLFVFVLGLRLYTRIGRDFHESRGHVVPWYKDGLRLSFVFPSFLLPLLGLCVMLVLPQWLIPYENYHPAHGNGLTMVGRSLTAWAGAFTVLLAYLIGRDAYNRSTGLIAAMMLATAMLHVQTSHFMTVDILLGFWLTAGVYCFLKISQKPRLGWYLFGGICTGLAIATKWSGIVLPGILCIAHAAACWKDTQTGKTGRWIHLIWLGLLALLAAHFFQTARSITPTLDIAFALYRDFYTSLWVQTGLGLLVSLIFMGSVYAMRYRMIFLGHTGGWFKSLLALYRPWVYLNIAILAGVVTFFIAAPMAYFDAKFFASNIAEQSKMHASGEPLLVFTLQYLNTASFFHTLDNLFYPSMDWFSAFFILMGSMYVLWRLLYQRCSNDLVLAAWVIPSFILYSTFHSKFPRYLDTILPVMTVFGAKLIVDLISIKPYFYNPTFPKWSIGGKRLAKYTGLIGGGLALTFGLIYGYAYVRIYDKPHTLVQAGEYLRQQQGRKKVTAQSWDEGLPGVHVESNDQIGIHTDRYAERDPKRRIDYLAKKVNDFDYIVLQSKRGYGTTLQNPTLFPVTNTFLKALFAEQLGFVVDKVFTNPPSFLGWEFRVDREDETARIYDHPKVIIFKKTQKIPLDQLKQLIANPPQWVHEITAREILEIRDGYPVFATPPSHPILRWVVMIQALGWMAFIFLFPLTKQLPDRGYAIAKIVGIAVFSWLCWLLASIHLLHFSPMQAWLIFIILLVLAVWMARKIHCSLWPFLKEKWLMLVGIEVLFFAIFALFLLIRMYHPNIYFGEKPMNFSFINATYRAETFPPEDPWISGNHINYYYYGHAVYSIIGRFAGVPPEMMFNIAGATIPALIALALFALVYAISRRGWLALLAVYLGLFSSHIISYFDLVHNEIAKGKEGFLVYITSLYDVLALTGTSVLYYLGLLGPAWQERFQSLSYDDLFWKARSSIFPGTAANEFPYWTNLFVDFHAHMLVVPFTLAFLTLLYAYFAQPRKDTSGKNLTGLVFILALLLGTVTCTNTWDFPGLMLGLLFIASVKFFRESDLLTPRKISTDWLSPETWQSIVRFPILPALGTLLLSYVLLYPFHFWFDSRVSSIAVMTEGSARLSSYLGFFGHLLFPLVILAVLLAVVRIDGKPSKKRAVVFCFFYAVIILLSQAASWILAKDFAKLSEMSLVSWLFGDTNRVLGVYMSGEPALPLDYTVVGFFLPLLLVLFILMWQRWRSSETVFMLLIGVLGLGLSLGIEFLYINEDNWSEPHHRWNTIFKFNTQIWYYFALFAALSLPHIWQGLRQMGTQISPWFSGISRASFVVVFAFILLLTVPFTVLAPALVTQSSGAIWRDGRGPRPTLDGLAWLKETAPGDYNTIQWLNRFVNGTPTIAEVAVGAYYDNSRFCSNTGLPAIMGWPNHVGERKHLEEKAPRIRDVDRIYLSPSKEEVSSLLGTYQVEYVLFGELEMKKRRGDQNDLPPLGRPSLTRFEKWGDLFSLVYRNHDTSVFKVNSNLNTVYGIVATAPDGYISPEQQKNQLPPAKRQLETGLNMFTGGGGYSNGAFDQPRGLCVDNKGYVYIADTLNHRMQVFRPDGTYAWLIGMEGEADGEFKELNDVTIDPANGNIYIADTWNQRIVLYDQFGTFTGSATYNLFGPRGIVFHPVKRCLYIADTGSHQIKVMSPDGKRLKAWGQNGTDEDGLREPVGIDVSPSGNIVVVDSLNKRVKMYTAEGMLLRIFPIQTAWDGTSGFESHIACMPDGSLYLTDPAERTVHHYREDGELIEKIKQDTRGQMLVRPAGITVTGNGGVLVTDHGLKRVLRIR
jgi:YYY domain-containing protein